MYWWRFLACLSQNPGGLRRLLRRSSSRNPVGPGGLHDNFPTDHFESKAVLKPSASRAPPLSVPREMVIMGMAKPPLFCFFSLDPFGEVEHGKYQTEPARIAQTIRLGIRYNPIAGFNHARLPRDYSRKTEPGCKARVSEDRTLSPSWQRASGLLSCSSVVPIAESA